MEGEKDLNPRDKERERIRERNERAFGGDNNNNDHGMNNIIKAKPQVVKIDGVEDRSGNRMSDGYNYNRRRRGGGGGGGRGGDGGGGGLNHHQQHQQQQQHQQRHRHQMEKGTKGEESRLFDWRDD